MSREQENLCDEIRSFVNPSSFAQHPTSIFRKRLQHYFRLTLDLSATIEDGVYHYNEQIISKLLFYSYEVTSSGTKCYTSHGIPWELMCANHDSSKKIFTKENATVLSSLIEAIIDPCLLPPCLTSVIVLGMLSICVEVFTSGTHMMHTFDQSPSLGIMQKAISRLIQSRPSAMVSNRMECYIRERVMCNLSCHSPDVKNITRTIQKVFNDYDTSRTLKILSIIKQLGFIKKTSIARFPAINNNFGPQKQVLLRPTILLLKEIDAIDVYLLKSHRRQDSKNRADLCSQCIDKLFPEDDQKRKRIKTSSLGDLHDGTTDDFKPSAVSFGFNYPQTKHDGRSNIVPWKKLMGTSGKEVPRESCQVCSKKGHEGKFISSLDITSLPLRMIEFRASLYEVVLELFGSSRIDESLIGNDTFSIFRMAIVDNPSASTRLCAIFAASSVGNEKGLLCYLRFILTVIEKDLHSCETNQKNSVNRLTGCIHIYREVLTECSLFDNPEQMWRGLKPLFDLALKLSDETTMKPVTNATIQVLLSAIGLLITKWGFIISIKPPSHETKLAFNSYVLRFSEEFEELGSWLDHRLSIEDKGRITSILQSLGISSIFNKVNDDDVKEVRGLQKDLWIYDKVQSVRSAHIRMGPKVSYKNKTLFSNKSMDTQHHNTMPKRKIRDREDSFSEEPIMDYINDDITKIVFSYLGYKLLVRATSVCRSWRTIGNSSLYWEPHFTKRFRPIFLEMLIPPSTRQDLSQAFVHRYCQRQCIHWRHRFDQQRQRDRSLNRVSASGWKHRYCRVFGCNVVIRKKEDEKKHMQVHSKEIQKKLGIIERAEQRRMVKAEKELLKKEAKSNDIPKSSKRTTRSNR